MMFLIVLNNLSLNSYLYTRQFIIICLGLLYIGRRIVDNLFFFQFEFYVMIICINYQYTLKIQKRDLILRLLETSIHHLT